MTDTTPVDVEPYDLDWLAPDGRIREIITRYNNPDSPQRKMLATLDLVWDRQRELEAIVRDLADRGAPPSYDEETCWYCDAWAARPPEQHEADCTWRKSVAWVSAHPVLSVSPEALAAGGWIGPDDIGVSADQEGTSG